MDAAGARARPCGPGEEDEAESRAVGRRGRRRMYIGCTLCRPDDCRTSNKNTEYRENLEEKRRRRFCRCAHSGGSSATSVFSGKQRSRETDREEVVREASLPRNVINHPRFFAAEAARLGFHCCEQHPIQRTASQNGTSSRRVPRASSPETGRGSITLGERRTTLAILNLSFFIFFMLSFATDADRLIHRGSGTRS